MTSLAMIAGMAPMASGYGEGGEQTAPLGRAVIGGLAFATIATLIILPAIFALLQRDKTRRSASIDPDDQSSPYYSQRPAGHELARLPVDAIQGEVRPSSTCQRQNGQR